MTISRKLLQQGLSIGIGVAFIVIIGMPAEFAERFVITMPDFMAEWPVVGSLLTLSQIFLIAIFLGTGYFVTKSVKDKSGMQQVAITGVIASVEVVLIMIVAMVFCTQMNALADNIDMTTFFPNVNEELISAMTFGAGNVIVGYILLIAAGIVGGAAGALMHFVPARTLSIAGMTTIMLLIIGLLQDQINTMISLPDAVWFVGFSAAGYYLAVTRNQKKLGQRLLEAVAVGAGLGIILVIILGVVGIDEETGVRVFGESAALMSALVAGKSMVSVAIIVIGASAVLGLIGGALSATPGGIHRAGLSILITILTLGILNVAGELTLLAAIIIMALLITSQLLMGQTSAQTEAYYEALPKDSKSLSRTVMIIIAVGFALILPQMLTGYITNVLDLIGLYIMMGLGLNIVVGYAGLLDLGYVAFFAIGAYTVGVLTTPNALTCGGVAAYDLDPDVIEATCTGVMNFWMAWPFAVLVSGLAGVILGIPVLRLRGDYLAIVTLGFGEIIRLLTLSDLGKPLMGGAQGIVSIPSPVVNLTALSGPLSSIPILSGLSEAIAEPISLSSPGQIYYLILAGIVLTAFVSHRLGASRLGRSWRAMRADERVGEAMGIHLVNSKLLAFSIGAAFAGIGGAIFGSYLKSIFPNSFTLLVSINVLSVVIIGGMGNIPGVFIGALVIFGLPEALREFQEYRLLMFGALLVITMLLRPEGLLPPRPTRLEDRAQKALAAEEGA